MTLKKARMKMNIIMAQMKRVCLQKKTMSVVVRVVSSKCKKIFHIYSDTQINFIYCTENLTEAIIGQIKVKVFCGNITKETTDAIVSSTNTSLDLSSGNAHIYSTCQYVLYY